jgi:hypothetical protein
MEGLLVRSLRLHKLCRDGESKFRLRLRTIRLVGSCTMLHALRKTSG